MARAARCDTCGVRAPLLIWGRGQTERGDGDHTLTAYICQGCGGVVTLRGAEPSADVKSAEPSLTT